MIGFKSAKMSMRDIPSKHTGIGGAINIASANEVSTRDENMHEINSLDLRSTVHPTGTARLPAYRISSPRVA
jgi:hypothetical protein